MEVNEGNLQQLVGLLQGANQANWSVVVLVVVVVAAALPVFESMQGSPHTPRNGGSLPHAHS